MSITLMLSSTGLGSWAHTNLREQEEARVSRCPLVAAHAPLFQLQVHLPRPGAEIQKPGYLATCRCPGPRSVVGPGSVLCGSSLGVPEAAIHFEALYQGHKVSKPQSLLLLKHSLVGEEAYTWANTISGMMGSAPLGRSGEGLGRSKQERWLPGTASWRRGRHWS